MTGLDPSQSYNINYLPVSEQINFSSSSSFSLDWNSNYSNLMYYELGFSNLQYNSVSNSLQAPYSFDLSMPRYALIYLQNIPDSIVCSNSIKPISFVIPLQQNGFNGINWYFEETNYEQEIQLNYPIAISQLSIVLFDEKARPLSLNNQDWSMLFEINTC